jgi:endonuclease I
MNRFFTFFLFTVLSVTVFGQIPPGYYDNAEGLSGYPLKTALFNIIKDHEDQGYSALWDLFQAADKLPPELTNSGSATDIIWDIYSYNPDGPNPYEFVAGTNQCGNYNSEGDCYNREHSFPKSWFNNVKPMANDAMHILPTDGYVNGRRGNNPYSEVGNASWTSQNGSKLGTSNVPGYSGTAFEPIDEFKGDIARIYFYMATRYEDIIAGWEENSESSDAVLDGTDDHVYETWYLNLMVKWHTEDPVSEKEQIRNESIYIFQHNRNPYVDHPEYVSLIWVDPTAVKDHPQWQVNVFPNPVSESLHIDYTGTMPVEYSIFSITGRKIKEGMLRNSNNTIPVKSFPRGLYLIIVRNTDGKMIYKTKLLKAS